MTIAGKKKKLLLCIIAWAMVVCVIFTVAQPVIAFAAEESEYSFEKSNVLDDLISSTISGKAFDIRDYPFDENGEIQLVSFIEYCYSYRANLMDKYALYIYVYNPKGMNLSTSNKQNKIQMAVAYDDEGNPIEYAKFSLEFCSKIESGDYKNLFYKFKVVDRKVNNTTFKERVNSNARRYDISGIELTKYGATNATEYGVSGTYIFTGYAQGYGPDANAKSTLNCDAEFLEVVSLSVEHTFYRSETSSLGAGHQNQLDTVYFSVPKRFIDTYGKLQRIKAEWYEYKTNDIVVTSNEEFYNKALPYIGAAMPDADDWYNYEYNKDLYYMLAENPQVQADTGIADWGWNLKTYIHPVCQRLCYLFYVDDIGEYDPYASTEAMGGVEGNDLYHWILNYNKSYEKGTLPIKDGSISADLFMNDIDESRKMNNENGVIQMGYSYYDFDAEVDLQTLQSWSSTSPSFWDNWVEFGLGAAFQGGPNEESRTVAPIQILKTSDLEGTDAQIAERLLVNISDIGNIKEAYKNATSVSGAGDEEEVLVLFRFATSDYYSADLTIIDPHGGFLGTSKKIEGQAYRAQESVFLDFDIIQLTFNRDGEYTVIPVVSNPMDIVNDITPPADVDEDNDWWKIVLAIVLLIVIVVVFVPILSRLILLVLWLITLPFKAITALIKLIKGLF